MSNIPQLKPKTVTATLSTVPGKYWLHDPVKMFSLVARRFRLEGNAAQEMDWAVEFLETGRISIFRYVPEKIAHDALHDEGARLTLADHPGIVNVLKFIVPEAEFAVHWERQGSEFAAFVAGKFGAGMGVGHTVLATVESGWKPTETKDSPFVGTVIYYRRK